MEFCDAKVNGVADIWSSFDLNNGERKEEKDTRCKVRILWLKQYYAENMLHFLHLNLIMISFIRMDLYKSGYIERCAVLYVF